LIWKKSKFQNFKISENNITSVKLAKVLTRVYDAPDVKMSSQVFKCSPYKNMKNMGESKTHLGQFVNPKHI
jgi:hypothetical protein